MEIFRCTRLLCRSAHVARMTNRRVLPETGKLKIPPPCPPRSLITLSATFLLRSRRRASTVFGTGCAEVRVAPMEYLRQHVCVSYSCSLLSLLDVSPPASVQSFDDIQVVSPSALHTCPFGSGTRSIVGSTGAHVPRSTIPT